MWLLLVSSELSNVLQDIFNGSASNKPFFTSVASITVHVKDVDNRPPWFQPCSRTNLGMAKLCVSGGYRGRVNLTEKEVSASTRGQSHVCPGLTEDILLLLCRMDRWCWSPGRCSPETETRTGASRSATGYCEVRTTGGKDGRTSEFTANSRFLSLPPPSGNEGNIFQIDEDTGNITMTKAADIAGPITLTILVNPYLPLDAL